MATLRKRYQVAWNNQPPVEVTTSARDYVGVSQTMTETPMLATLSMLHAALVREGHDLPVFDEWIDLVDEVDEGATVVTDIEGPTPPAASDGELSTLPA